MPHPRPQLILGVDPGYARLGWAVLQTQNSQERLIDCGCLQTTASISLLARYAAFQAFLQQLLDHYHPQLLGLEQLIFARNVSTALPVAEVRGLVIAEALRRELMIRQFHPSTIKSTITGNGRADKAAMRKMVSWQLQQDQPPNPELATRLQTALDDTIDAIGVALTAARVPTSV